ncbi:MAG: phosphotransferase family protein [Chloroflexi bacterium]|nr:phosphotransferase family protein [Chloroflexota bacterium]
MLNVEVARPQIAAYLSAKLSSDDGVEVGPLERITIGHSRGMFRVNASYRQGGEAVARSFALRVEQAGMFGTNTLDEVRTMRSMRAAGFPVANIRFVEFDPAVIGTPFFVMDWVEGSSGPPNDAALRDYVTKLHELHQIDWRKKEVPFARIPSVPIDAVHQQVDRWMDVHRWGRVLPEPLLEEAATWLKRNAPEDLHLTLVHGDPGPLNFIHKGDDVQAFTDWEFSHIGDPNEDWLFLGGMRGRGVMEPPQWREYIADVTGHVITKETWAYWDVFNQFKGACANTSALRIFITGANPAPNMAAIGTALKLSMVQHLSTIIGMSYAREGE